MRSVASVRLFSNQVSFDLVWVPAIESGLGLKVNAECTRARRVSTAANYEYWLMAVLVGSIVTSSAAS